MAGGSYFSMVYLTSLKEKPEPPRVKKAVPLVKTEAIEYANIPISIEREGRLSSTHKVDLIAEVKGAILAGDVPLKPGQSFSKGELLFKIYDEEAKLALRASKSRFLTSVANVLPDIKYDFQEDYEEWLHFFDAIDLQKPLPKLPEIQSEQEKIYLAGKNIFNDYYTIQSSEITLGKHQIYAPFDGAYTSVNYQEGSIANIGTKVATIIRTDLLELEVSVKVDDVRWLKKGQPVALKISNKTVAQGTLSRVSDFVDPKTQSVLVYVSVPNDKNYTLFEGMYLSASFNGLVLNQVMKIPRSAVFNFDEVFLVNGSKLHKTRIKVVKVDQNHLYFFGPREGENVAVELPLNPVDKMQVRVQPLDI